MSSNAIKFLALVLLLCLVFSIPAPARAQVTGATLSGTITDAQGGAVVGAKISVKNSATGITVDTTTNASGSYSVVNLVPAPYDVSITAPGFQTAVSKVTLVVGTQQELSVSLTVGQVSQTVEVTGAAPVVETTNATLSGEVAGEQIVDLPLNGRDWVSLATLTPGVAQVRPHELVTQPGGSTRGLGIQMTINGARPQQNVYRLNGVIVNDYANAGPGNVLGANAGVDAIQEFSVLTTNYSAEYGFTSGGVINAITKSGTNSLHGSAYEFLRNDYLDAADRFEDPTPQNPAGFPKGNFVRNQFGASAGWKVLRDRFFLFGNYEGFRQVQALPQSGSTLTSNARLGIINDANGNPLPALTGACPYAKYDVNGMTNEAPGKAAVCVDNFVFAEINPCVGGVTLACASGAPPGTLSPLPNGSLLLPNNNDNGNYTSDIGEDTSDNYATIRADFRISDKDSLVGSWYRDTSTWIKPGIGIGVFGSTSGFQVPHGAYSLEETHIFSSTLVNTARLGLDSSDLFSPSFSNANPISHATTITVVNPAGTGTSSVPIGILPSWVAGGGSIGGNGNSGNSTAVSGPGGGFTGAAGFSAQTKKIEAFDDLDKTIGQHTLKFGVMFMDDHENWLDGPALPGGGGPSYGALSGGSYGACSNAIVPLPLSCGGGVAAFLMDISHTVRMPVEEPFIAPGTVHHYRSQVYGAYFQDDWKMRSNLTLNLGLRYEMSTIPTEVDDKIDNLTSIQQTIGINPCVANPQGIAVCQGFNNQTFQHNPTYLNFEPRIGFAWDPFHDGKTSVRGGAGIFDVLPMSYMFALNSMQTAPNGEIDLSYGQQTCTTGLTCLPDGVTGAPAGWGRFPTLEANDALTTSAAQERYGFIQPNPKRPYVAQYNLNIQRQITPTLSLMVAYAGSRSWHDPFQIDDLNTVVPYLTSAGYIFPNPVGSGCSPGPPNCSATDATLGLPIAYANSTTNPACVNGAANKVGSCISVNNGITPGLLINSNVAQIQSSVFDAQSWYNSLQVRVDKRISHGLMMGGSFTWGKSFDTSSSSFASDNYANNPSAITPWWDLSRTKGLSDFNVTRSMSINGLYTVPTPTSWHGAEAIAASGWGIGANFLMSDGIPLWPLMVAGDSVGMLNGGPYDIPDLVPGCNQALTSNARQTMQYLNPACYTLPQAPSMAFYNGSGTIGQAGYQPGCDPEVNAKTHIPAFPYPNCVNLLGNDPRNIVIGPGLINLDFSVTKDTHITRISEAADLQFRAEFFNIMNRTNYAFPAANNLGSLNTVGAPVANFGILSNTQSPNREIQFALKFIF